MSDSSYRYPKDGGIPIFFNHKNFPIVKAVAASTCVPFIFTPVKIFKDYFNNNEDYKRVKSRLVDGGVSSSSLVRNIASLITSFSL